MSQPATPDLGSIQPLHDAYCQFAGVTVKLRYEAIRLWWDLLKDYNGNTKLLHEDLKIVLIYLRAQIQKEKRNPGAIKLINLLQLDQFEADVAEAKFLRGKKKAEVNSPKEPAPQGWQSWLAENYPDNAAPGRFEQLPDYIQSECRKALQ